ncbi:MAG: lipopolysaccharide kinase InaA family protein [Oceanicoccus sp.]
MNIQADTENFNYIPVRGDDYYGLVCVSAGLEALCESDGYDDFVRQRITLKEDQGRAVFCAVLAGGEKILCKVYREVGLVELVRRLIFGSRAKIGHKKTEAFFTTSALSAKSLGYLVKKTGLLSCESIHLLEFLDDSKTLLDIFSGDISDNEKRKILSELSLGLARIHSNGYYHGDLKLRNILCKKNSVYFVDLDGLSELNRRKTIEKDIARLIVGLSEVGVASTDLVGLLTEYCQIRSIDMNKIMVEVIKNVTVYQNRHQKKYGRNPVVLKLN